MKSNDQLLVCLGVPHTQGTNNDPMDFATRRLLVNHHYPSAIVVPIHDEPSDMKWSKNLDKIVATLAKESDKVTMYCGRDGFKSHYRGHHKVEAIADVPQYSGTDMRVDARKSPIDSVDFRKGVTYGLAQRYKTTYMTVDIAVLGNGGVLMGRRPGQDVYRFPGGFVDFADKTLEETCFRELNEELGIEAKDRTNFEYVCTQHINDWRYRDRPDQRIMTTLYSINLEQTVGDVTPDGDEFEDFTYISLDEVGAEMVNPEHLELFHSLIRRLDGNIKGASNPRQTKPKKVTA